jgi:hypothetical protein
MRRGTLLRTVRSLGGSGRLACAVAVLACSLAASTALAQHRQNGDADVEAHGYFERGRHAYEDAHYEEALAAFQQAYSLRPLPELLYNIGQCADRIGRRDLAIDAFQRYLDAMPDASNRVEVATRLQLLRDAEAAEVAAAHPVAPTNATRAPAPAPHDGGGDVLSQWWFWTIVGVVVVGAAVGITLAVTSSGGTAQPPTGDLGPGGIVVALEGT